MRSGYKSGSICFLLTLSLFENTQFQLLYYSSAHMLRHRFSERLARSSERSDRVAPCIAAHGGVGGRRGRRALLDVPSGTIFPAINGK